MGRAQRIIRGTLAASARYPASAEFALIILIAAGAPSQAAEPASPAKPAIAAAAGDVETCSQRYHAKLRDDVLPKARATQAVADKLRAPDPDMPGHWLFWDGSGLVARTAHQRRLMATPQIDVQANLMCAHQILMRGGRIRCLKWQSIPADYKQPEPKPDFIDPVEPEISPAERRIARHLSRRVVHKGALGELEHGTAFYHIVQRTTDELTAYASQPHRTAICSGAGAMIGFYRRQLKPLAQKSADAKKLSIESRANALATAGKAIGTAVAAKADLAAHLRKLLAGSLDEAEQAALAQIEAPLKILTKARDMLSDQRIEAIPAARREALRKDLRNIEFAIYSEGNEKRLRELSSSFQAVLQAITDAHTATCTCKR